MSVGVPGRGFCVRALVDHRERRVEVAELGLVAFGNGG